mgnify:CR=1 FL=1
MLKLPNYSEDCLEVLIMKAIKENCSRDYFITVQFLKKGEQMPLGMIAKMKEKIGHNSPKSFKFIYTEGDWRLLLTFIERNKPVEKKLFANQRFLAFMSGRLWQR